MEHKLSDFSGGCKDMLSQMFLDGPIWDGNVVSKAARDELVKMGLAQHAHGFAFLTAEGVKLCTNEETRKEIKSWRNQNWNIKLRNS